MLSTGWLLRSTQGSTRRHPELDGVMRKRFAVCGQEDVLSHDPFERFPVDCGYASCLNVVLSQPDGFRLVQPASHGRAPQSVIDTHDACPG